MNSEKETHNLIWNEIKDIRENHLAHIEIDLAKVTNDISWLMRYHWVIMTSSIGALIAAIFNLI